jgi:hypothetical protein
VDFHIVRIAPSRQGKGFRGFGKPFHFVEHNSAIESGRRVFRRELEKTVKSFERLLIPFESGQDVTRPFQCAFVFRIKRENEIVTARGFGKHAELRLRSRQICIGVNVFRVNGNRLAEQPARSFQVIALRVKNS